MAGLLATGNDAAGVLGTAQAMGAGRLYPPDSAVFDGETRQRLFGRAVTLENPSEAWLPDEAASGEWAAVLPYTILEVGREIAVRHTADLPGGWPLYLLLSAVPSLPGSRWRQSARVVFDGEPAGELDDFVRDGPAPPMGESGPYRIHDLVLAPPAPGRHVVEIGLEIEGEAAGSVYPRSSASVRYDLTVGPGEEVGPVALVDARDGARYVALGDEWAALADDPLGVALGSSLRASRTAGPADWDTIGRRTVLPAWQEGSVIRAEGLSPLFRLEGGRRRWIANVDEFAASGVAWDAVHTWPHPVVHSIPLVPREGMVVRGAKPTVYLVDQGRRRAFPSLRVFEGSGHSWDDVVKTTERWLHALPEGPPVSA